MDEALNFYFLEMNTRLQVEHPVTELITGIDLVKEQIKIARGEAISFKQEDLKIRGHAVELRVYVEDPANNFLPDIGTLQTYITPKGPGVRVDDGFEQGMEIPIYYDPMISKLCAYGRTRDEAIQRMLRALQEYTVEGIVTNIPFHRWALKHPRFVAGDIDTGFIPQEFEGVPFDEDHLHQEVILAAAALSAYHRDQALTRTLPQGGGRTGMSAWRTSGWR